MNVVNKSGLWIVLIFLTLLSGCNNIFLQPNNVTYTKSSMFKIKPIEYSIPVSEKVQLHSWLFNSQNINKKPSILFFHGNAQNLSSHVYSVYWLAKLGYPVLIVDYRGYGKSSGNADIDGSIVDIQTASRWFIKTRDVNNIFIFGQSLGASLSISAFKQDIDLQNKVSGFILEAGFAEYRLIVKDALAKKWPTKLFTYPTIYLISNKINPREDIKLINKPMLIIHSKDDQIIPLHHGQMLANNAQANMTKSITIDGSHIASNQSKIAMEEIILFLNNNSPQ